MKNITSVQYDPHLWTQLVNEPEHTIQTICEHIGSGGTTTELAKIWCVPHGRLMYWIRSDESRKRRFTEANQDRNEYTIESVLAELRKLAVSDIRNFFNSDGSIKPVDQWPDDSAGCIQSIESEELFEGEGREKQHVGFVKKVKFWDKLKAIELIGKNLALFVDRNRVDVHVTLEDLIHQSRQLTPRNVDSIDAAASHAHTTQDNAATTQNIAAPPCLPPTEIIT